MGIRSWLSIVFTFAVLFSFTANAKTFESDHILRDVTVAKCAYCALKSARFGRSEYEWAFWVVENEDGTLGCVPWESNGQQKRKATTTNIPTNSIAMFHTHPDDAVSINDHDRQMAYKLEESHGLGVVFYILAGKYLGFIDPVNKAESKRRSDWIMSSSWISQLTKEETKNACLDSGM